MPHHSPADPLAAIQQMKRVPSDGSIKILATFRNREHLWYEVVASDRIGEMIGHGWIHSVALVGQQLNSR